MPYYPPTVNDAEAHEFAMEVARGWVALACFGVAQSRNSCLSLQWRLWVGGWVGCLPAFAWSRSRPATRAHPPRRPVEPSTLAPVRSRPPTHQLHPPTLPPTHPPTPPNHPSRLFPAPGRVADTEATMAGEDFAFIARAVPSCFVFLVGAWAGGVRALVLCPPGGCACMGACMCICVWGGGCLHGRERGVRTWINGPPPPTSTPPLRPPGHPQRDLGLGARPAHASLPVGRGGAARRRRAARLPSGAVPSAVQCSSRGGGAQGRAVCQHHPLARPPLQAAAEWGTRAPLPLPPSLPQRGAA